MVNQDSKTAVKPDVFLSFHDIGMDKRTPEEKRKDLDPKDLALSAMVSHDGWPVLNEFIEDLKSQMDDLIAASIANGSSFEDVGRLTVVANLAKEKLYAVQKRVLDAREVAEKTGV